MVGWLVVCLVGWLVGWFDSRITQKQLNWFPHNSAFPQPKMDPISFWCWSGQSDRCRNFSHSLFLYSGNVFFFHLFVNSWGKVYGSGWQNHLAYLRVLNTCRSMFYKIFWCCSAFNLFVYQVTQLHCFILLDIWKPFLFLFCCNYW